ncbi:MAG TPA: hypothetical protein VMZ50_11145 [Phycisphaerae bacterium]|nr:hypothetical protein [Phycisphaerae bacterium]
MREVRFVLVHGTGTGGGLYLTCRRGVERHDVEVTLRNPDMSHNSFGALGGRTATMLHEALLAAMRDAPASSQHTHRFCFEWAVRRVLDALTYYAATGWNDREGWVLLDFENLSRPGVRDSVEANTRFYQERGGQL